MTQPRAVTAPKWYFGWNIVAAASVLTLLSVGLRLGIGPFFLPISSDLGFSRSLLASIVAAGMLCYGLAMPVAGEIINRWGTRSLVLAGAAIVDVAIGWAVVARSPAAFFLSFGILLSIGLAFLSQVTFAPIISHWFIRQRGKALLYLATGSMAGMALLTPVMTGCIEAFGWRATLLGFAVILTVLSIPSALVIMRDDAPHQADLHPGESASKATAHRDLPTLPLLEALRTQPFWMVCLGLFSCGFSMNLLGTHGVPMLMDHGFDAHTSAFGIGTIGAVAIVGTLFLGRIADRLPRRNILATIYGVRGLGFFALVIVGTHWELYAAASVSTVNAAAKPSRVARQPAVSMAKVSTGVMIAMPAIEPVDRKNSAMPRWRVNQPLMTGVSATGLVKARPMDSSTPKASRKLVALAVLTHQNTAASIDTLPSSRTERVPKRAIRWPATGMARP
jgi:MFS family permease